MEQAQEATEPVCGAERGAQLSLSAIAAGARQTQAVMNGDEGFADSQQAGDLLQKVPGC